MLYDVIAYAYLAIQMSAAKVLNKFFFCSSSVNIHVDVLLLTLLLLLLKSST